MKEIFSSRLKSARRLAGLSVPKLVAKMEDKVSKQAISKYELGKMLPSSAVLIELSKALGVDVDYFFRPTQLQVTQMEFRKKSTLSKHEEESVKEKALDFMERYLELEMLLGIKSPFVMPLESNTVKDVNDIEKVASALREKWGLGKESVKNMLDQLEDRGVKILLLDAPSKFHGLSLKIDGSYLIVVNQNDDAYRRRFTITHELAHLVLDLPKQLEDKEVEKLCHRFSSAFLMPRESFIREFGDQRTNFTLDELLKLKSYFGVSIQAIIYRAFDLGLISLQSKDNFFIAWSKMGFKMKEPDPDEKLVDEPDRFYQLVSKALSEGIVSITKAAHLAGLKLPDFRNKFKLIDGDGSY